MADYIEREKVTELIDYHQEEYFEAESYFGLLKEDFLQLPSADVQPMVHGEWHSRFYFRESTKAYDCEMRVCSICGSEWSYDAETWVSDYYYCPNCGARMDGGA